MDPRFSADSTIQLPQMFCWTKFGTEAGEVASSILRRKEWERQSGDGVFLWGIGNAIGPSLEELLGLTDDPKVVFTPMLSQPAAKDITPSRVAVWRRGRGLDGESFDVPRHARVTSRVGSGNRPHYALVCRREAPITHEPSSRSFTASSVWNLRSGAPVGSSQVTSVVRRAGIGSIETGARYRVAFIADLVAPYLVTLTEHAVA